MDYTDAGLMTGYADVPMSGDPGMSGATMIIFLIIAVAVYLYSAYCLLHIAKKTNTPNEWLAWIPLANIVLMVQIARLPLWWIVGLVIPYLNIAVAAYVWWKIAEQRRRPGWWGILMLIGPVNLVLLWFLAFKEADNQAAPMTPPPAATPPTPPQAPA